MPSPTENLPTESVRAAQLRAVGAAFLRRRPLVVAPTAALVLALLARAHAPRRQLAALGAGMATLVAFFAWEALRARTRPARERPFFLSLLATFAGVLGACVATGGGESPLTPLLFAPLVTGFAAFGRRRERAALLGCAALAAVVLAGLPAGVPFPPVPPGARGALAAVAVLAASALLAIGVGGLTDAYATAGDALGRARDEVLTASEVRTRALETLSARLAHEIKNPLTAVKGLVELLAADADGERAHRRFAVVTAEIARIEALVRDYLSFARPFDALRAEPVALAAVAAGVLEAAEGRAARAGVTLTLTGDHDLRAEADPRRLAEALQNLVLNALEATAPGGAITLAVFPGEAPDTAQIVVADTGRGMGPAELAQLGTAFYTTRVDGTGLGVVLARAVARQHGGALRFESEQARGTRAVFTLRTRGPWPES